MVVLGTGAMVLVLGTWHLLECWHFGRLDKSFSSSKHFGRLDIKVFLVPIVRIVFVVAVDSRADLTQTKDT